jgi:hypothetical protein
MIFELRTRLHDVIYQKTIIFIVGFEVLTAMVVKSCIFWYTTSYSPLKVSDVSEDHVASIFRIE